MNIEHRPDGYYIVTEEKTNKNETIVIKLNSELDSQTISYSTSSGIDTMMNNLNLVWTLRHNDDLGLYVEIEATNRLKTYKETYSVNDNVCIDELVSIVKDNGTLEDCKEIQKAMYKTYNKLFLSFLENDRILHSNVIVEGLVKVKDNNKVLGHGTRFIINKNEITICEYTGKDISSHVYPNLSIVKGSDNIKIATLEYLENGHQVFSSKDDIGYLKYKINTSSCTLEHVSVVEDIRYPNLKVPYNYTDKENMIEYCKKNNASQEIIKYKIALKGKVELLNIDEYMVNEYLI